MIFAADLHLSLEIASLVLMIKVPVIAYEAGIRNTPEIRFWGSLYSDNAIVRSPYGRLIIPVHLFQSFRTCCEAQPQRRRCSDLAELISPHNYSCCSISC